MRVFSLCESLICHAGQFSLQVRMGGHHITVRILSGALQEARVLRADSCCADYVQDRIRYRSIYKEKSFSYSC